MVEKNVVKDAARDEHVIDVPHVLEKQGQFENSEPFLQDAEGTLDIFAKFGYPTTISCLIVIAREVRCSLHVFPPVCCVTVETGVRVSGSTLLVVSAVTNEVDHILMFDHCVCVRAEEDFDITVLAPANLIEYKCHSFEMIREP